MSAKAKKVVNRKDVTKARWTWEMMKRNKIGYFFIAPFMIIFFLFTIIPVALSLVLGFTNFNMLEFPDIVWLDNYVQLFLDDELFITAIKNTLIMSCIIGPSTYALSFGVAWFINELPPKLRALVTLIFYAPSISGGVYMIWGAFFSSDAYGYVNGTLMYLGFIDEPILWFKTEQYVWPLIIAVALWSSLGTSFLSFIAGLQGIDKAQFEAGAIDGIKNRWQELWYVTLPNMKPQMMFGAILSITSSFGFGAVITQLCGFPSVNYCAYMIQHHIDDYGSTRWEIGYASAISFILFLMCFGANMLIRKLLSKVGN